MSHLTQSLEYVGRPARRVDALDKVTGRAKYIADYRLPGMLHARCLRSTLPHARIVKLDPTPALSVPGVRAVITSDDFVDHGLYGFPVKDKYMLAYQKVRYVGEAIAAVAADTPEAAMAGVQAIVCELAPLPTLFDAERALDPDAPQVGPDRSDGRHPNLKSDHMRVRKGNAEAELAQCPIVLERCYFTDWQEHAYIEPEGVLAIPTPEGGVVVYAPNQSPFINQGNLAMTLGLPRNLVRVIQPTVGGSFGGKDDIVYESSAQSAKLALITGRPVRMILSREESLVASYKRDAMHMRVRLGANRDGTLRACYFRGIIDSGAYASETPFTAWRASIHAMGAYRYDACDVDVYCVYTNNGYAGAFRGFGNPEVCFAIEQTVDELADMLGVDPIDLRLKNCLRLGDETVHGQQLNESVGLIECLTTARQISDWDRKRAAYSRQTDTDKRRGTGVAIMYHGMSLGAEGADYASATASVLPDYSVELISGLTDYGTGSRTVFTLIAAEELGVRPERIHIQRPDTNTAIESGPTVASRTTVLGGNAMRIAARNLRHTLDIAAASLLRCEPQQLIRVGEHYIGPDEEPVAWERVVDHAREMGLILSAHGKWEAPKIHWDHHQGRGTPYMAYVYGAQIAEVEVDMHTGSVRVLHLWAVHDVGKVIFPEGAYGQLYGGIAQGLGYALTEQIAYRDGYIQQTNFDTYLIPSSMDVPEITVQFVESAYSHGPYGAKNIAEPAMVPTAPAIANAIAHATGRRVRALPMSLERVLLDGDLQPPASSEPAKVSLSIASRSMPQPTTGTLRQTA